ncbi:hypothetical protein [Streptomyces sp. NPDC047000]|uniref:hypothetical protein n=1 Tax=Streptomyces sp. NPDC047000 TaxID=3155474 RepID=UPI003403272E
MDDAPLTPVGRKAAVVRAVQPPAVDVLVVAAGDCLVLATAGGGVHGGEIADEAALSTGRLVEGGPVDDAAAQAHGGDRHVRG